MGIEDRTKCLRKALSIVNKPVSTLNFDKNTRNLRINLI